MNDTAMSPSLDEKISYNEAYKVILDMEDSAPGSNGLTINLFRTLFLKVIYYFKKYNLCMIYLYDQFYHDRQLLNS